MTDDVGAQIETTLIVLLRTLIETRQVEARARPTDLPFTLHRFDGIAGRPVASRAETLRAALARSPITASLELAIRTMGEQAHAAGLDMIEIAEAASEANAGRSDHCRNILNSRWDGIGHWRA